MRGATRASVFRLGIPAFGGFGDDPLGQPRRRFPQPAATQQCDGFLQLLDIGPAVHATAEMKAHAQAFAQRQGAFHVIGRQLGNVAAGGQ